MEYSFFFVKIQRYGNHTWKKIAPKRTLITVSGLLFQRKTPKAIPGNHSGLPYRQTHPCHQPRQTPTGTSITLTKRNRIPERTVSVPYHRNAFHTATDHRKQHRFLQFCRRIPGTIPPEGYPAGTRSIYPATEIPHGSLAAEQYYSPILPFLPGLPAPEPEWKFAGQLFQEIQDVPECLRRIRANSPESGQRHPPAPIQRCNERNPL